MLMCLIILSIVLAITMIFAAWIGYNSPIPSGDIPIDDRIKSDNYGIEEYPNIITVNDYDFAKEILQD